MIFHFLLFSFSFIYRKIQEEKQRLFQTHGKKIQELEGEISEKIGEVKTLEPFQEDAKALESED